MNDSDLPESSQPDTGQAFDFYVEQLETYLDGELGHAEAATVRERLTLEPAYAASLARLQAQRHLRIDHLCQPGDDEAAARLSHRASQLSSQNVADSQPLRLATPRAWWLGLAAAACLLVGFGVGTFAGLDFGNPPAPIMSNPLPEDDNPNLVSNDSDDGEVRPADTTRP